MMIDPKFMTMTEWTDAVSFLLVNTGVVVMKLMREEDFTVWARNLLNNTTLSGLDVPDPEYFADWREWAMRFNEATDLLG